MNSADTVLRCFNGLRIFDKSFELLSQLSETVYAAPVSGQVDGTGVPPYNLISVLRRLFLRRLF